MLSYPNLKRFAWGTRSQPDKFARYLISSLVLTLVFSLALQLFLEPITVRAASFSAGDLVIYRVGTGSGTLVNTGNAVFLDEYTSGGTLVQSVALPTTASGANKQLISSGTATSEGLLTRSADGKYLILTGYGRDLGGSGSVVSTASATVPRVVGRVDASGNVDTSTALTDFADANNPRSATSTNGTDLWVAGAGGGERYATLGGTTSTQLSTTATNLRQTTIFNDQLYVSTSSGTAFRIGTVGTGTPTTAGQTITSLPGFPTSAGSPYAFYLADLNSSIPGPDTLYVADDGAGLIKYSLVGGSWVTNGTVGTASDAYRGLTASVSGSSVTLFATRKGGSTATGGGELVSLTDASGYNGAFAGIPNLLATAATNTAFRGIAFAPESGSTSTAPGIVTSPANQNINTGATATLTVTASGSQPLSYQWYQGNSGDTSTPVGTNSPSFTTPALNVTTSYWVQVTNTVGSVNSQTATITVSTPPPSCSTVPTPIHDVQGTTDTSPLNGNTVTVQGVVIGDNEGPAPALQGFYLQDQHPDNDPATSEGIFIFEGNANTVSLGQVVQVTGKVSEFQGQTEITSTNIQDCGTTATVTPVDVTLPIPAPVNGVSYLERFESMLVRFPQTLYVTEHFQLGRFGQIIMSANSRLPQPTNIVLPGGAAQAQQAANDLNKIIVDDATNDQNPDPILFGRGGQPLSASNTLRGGDSATNIIGVLNYTWAGNAASGNAYRLRPINALGGGVPNFQPTDPRPAGPPAVGGNLKVASFNVLNYFLTLDIGTQANCGPIGSKQECRGAETQEELTRQQQKLNQALLKLDGDVVGMMELENTQNAQGQDVNPVADIVGRHNTSLGSDVYGYINTGVIGTDTIRVGLIYKKARVTPVGNPLIDLNPVHNRPPVAQLFTDNNTGEKVTIIVNHFKSKSSCPTDAANVDPDQDQGDGQGCWNQTRVNQANALISYINGTVIPTNGDPDVLLIGDFNSYAKEDPIKTLETAGYINQVARFSGSEAYSYVFDGQWGYLDQGLASASLSAQITGAGDYHINSDEPSVLDYNTNFKTPGQIASLFNADEFRTSDHDPVVLGLNLHAFPVAKDDTYNVSSGTPATLDVLANDTGSPLQIVGNTNPSHGTLVLNPDGTYTYTSNAGFTGQDSFKYTVSNAVQLFKTNLPPLNTFNGVKVTGGAYGSALYPVPGSSDEFYGLTDRGPNVDGPNGTKVEPIPDFDPAIGKFKFVNGQAILEQSIPLKAADGSPYSGRVNPQATTGETITDLNGNVLATDPNGYDSEGLVALADGTFWVSDEYGPFITHFDASGKQIGRLSPFDSTLPAELKFRVVNRGMEGLALTPDGSTLVGTMQSALQQTDLNGSDAKNVTIVRIVTYKLATGELHEYLYLLDNPKTNKTAISEITALSNTTFLMDERDGNYPPSSYKKLWKIDISGATDIGPASTLSGATYNASAGGLLVGGKSLEALVVGQDTNTSLATLAGKGITPVSKTLYLDVINLLTTLDPQGRFFSHDKLEGVAVIAGGTKLVLSNDSDFGIDGLANSTAPFQLHAKVSPATGVQDDGEFLVVSLGALPAATSTATVTLNVQAAQVAKLKLTTVPASVTAGSPFDVTVTAYDSSDNIVTNAQVSVQFSSSDNQATLPAGTIATTDNGVHTFTGLILKTAGLQTLTATGLLGDGTQVQSDPASIAGNPAATASLQLTTATTATVDSPADVSVTAQDAYGNTVTGYSGTIHFTSSDAKAILPADYTFFAADNGTHTFTGGVTFKTAGVQSITISDGSLTATQSGIQVNPGVAQISLSNLSAVYDGTPKFATATTTPAGLKVNITYKQGNTVVASPTEAGSYDVTATIDDPNYTGSQTDTLVIDKAATSTVLSSSVNPSVVGQSVTFFAQVSILPPGGGKLTGTVTFAVDGANKATVTLDTNGSASFTPSSLSAGNHTISATYSGTGNFQGSDDSLTQTVSTSAPASKLTVQSVKGVYGGTVNLSAKLTASGKPVSGKTISFTLNGTPVCGSTGLPACPTTNAQGSATLQNVSLPASINPGTYPAGVGASVVGGSTSGSASLTIAKAAATISLSNLIQTYDGSPKFATATTTPAGLNVTISYTQGGKTFNSPTNAGNYKVTATINDPRYSGKTTGTLVITKATASITLSNLTQSYDGKPKFASATTVPAGLKVNFSYSQHGKSVSKPTNAGSYDVLATVSDANYTGTQTGVLVIQGGTPTAKTGGVRNLKAISATLTGTVDANFAEITEIYFEWGVPFNNQVNVLLVTTQVSGNGNTSVSADLTGLSANTTYYFRLVVKYGSGSEVRSDVITSFHTPKK